MSRRIRARYGIGEGLRAGFVAEDRRSRMARSDDPRGIRRVRIVVLRFVRRDRGGRAIASAGSVHSQSGMTGDKLAEVVFENVRVGKDDAIEIPNLEGFSNRGICSRMCVSGRPGAEGFRDYRRICKTARSV